MSDTEMIVKNAKAIGYRDALIDLIKMGASLDLIDKMQEKCNERYPIDVLGCVEE